MTIERKTDRSGVLYGNHIYIISTHDQVTFMADRTIFYSWQSDTDVKLNRYFIQDALKKAIKQIGKSLDCEEAPRLDQDTNNVPGSPEITNTILNKIDQCSVFVADLSFIARTKRKKNLPNPNVLLELGYAFKAVSASRIITVMNEAFGSANDGLPFDLAHRRWPISYNLTSDASDDIKKEQKGKLVSMFYEAIMEIYQSGLLENEEQQDVLGTSPKWGSSSFLADGELLCRLTGIHDPEQIEILWYNASQAFIRLIPFNTLEYKSQLDMFELTKQHVRPFGHLGPIWEGRNKYGAVFIDAVSKNEKSTRCLTQVFLSGEIWGVSKFSEWAIEKRCIITQDIESMFLQCLSEYITISYRQLAIGGPIRLVFGLSGVENFVLKMPNYYRSVGICVEDEIIYETTIDNAEVKNEEILLPFFNQIWESCGCRRPDN